MGGHFYSTDDRSTRAAAKGYNTKSTQEIFSRNLHESMNPKDVSLRESRDSEQHPYSFPAILGLDFTGSMGQTPHELIKEGLPHLISSIIERGVEDISLCFIGIGDHVSDRAPLQIGQFESGDEQLDMWLERSWLEGNGGGNGGESYLLALVFAAFVCQTDHWDKRGQKGVLVTVGDEPPLTVLPKSSAIDIFGDQASDWFEGHEITAAQLMDIVRERWEVFHLHVNHGGRYDNRISEKWHELLGAEHVHVAESPRAVAKAVANIVYTVAQSQDSTTRSSSVPAPAMDAPAGMDAAVPESEPTTGEGEKASSTPTGSEAEQEKASAQVETI